MKGHNGIDYGIKVGTPIFSPIRGKVKVVDSGNKGYGLHVKIRDIYGREVVLAHLSHVFVKDGSEVHELDKVGLSGNTGFSTGPHLHFGFRRLKVDFKTPRFNWKVLDHSNGYYGYIDILPYTFTWKGTSLKSNL
jgi:murein DD-endopeptidase MepM/ murein hydrolase activator NlpD|tara:strand:- start:755 stop:1159 length:405 start_codon:yes stop_codon:yes gene_type:complete